MIYSNESLATIQQWTRECYAQNGSTAHIPSSGEQYSALALSDKQHEGDFKTIFSELRDQLFDMKKEIKSLNNRIDDTKGFTTRADKKNAIGRGGHGDGYRFGATPLAENGNFSQSRGRGGPSRKMAFHKPSGTFVPLCGNPTCSATAEKHWHRDCPNGGPRGHIIEAHGFSIADNEHDIFATLFQSAMESDDAARFDAVCYLAGGTPELYDTVSAYSFFANEERVPDAIEEYVAYCQPVEHMSSFFVAGGATESAPVAAHHLSTAPSPPPLASDTGCDIEAYDDGLLPTVNYNFDGTAPFADRFFTAFPEREEHQVRTGAVRRCQLHGRYVHRHHRALGRLFRR
ncbi:hypothetical protein CYMTET_22624 [Cymbomonas tetramitiformis]|uniref:Uncharacterized protein n=1 Tax=Cymbomonas tetramitiformis TaxID=36881 RepID=A0AAE0FZV2_9CHLO|nr:hypothetical protein CYMTET_45995 [Cymbomonas tetramitiformis]KAK3268899.1 hypothetical protein CYMTET_22624 [Cymbomonas tetramitiformis]